MANGYKQAMLRFEKAVREHEMKGCRHPEEHDEIEREYHASRDALIRKLQYRRLAAEAREDKTSQMLPVKGRRI